MKIVSFIQKAIQYMRMVADVFEGLLVTIVTYFPQEEEKEADVKEDKEKVQRLEP